jgi:hypothetical protein
MEPEILYIVLWRMSGTAHWSALHEGQMPTRRLALNLIECKMAAGSTFEFAIVGGPIETTEEIAAEEAALGAF